MRTAALPFSAPGGGTGSILATFLFPSVSPSSLSGCLFSVYLTKKGNKSSISPPLLPHSSLLCICLLFSPSLFHPLLPSVAGWLIVAPQLCGWHMHQSLTNTTWSPETHSSTKNASVFFLSPLVSFHLPTASPCSKTRVHFLPFCRTITFLCASEGKMLPWSTRTSHSSTCILSWRYSLCFIREKKGKRSRKTKLHLFRPMLLNLPAGVDHCISRQWKLIYQWQLLCESMLRIRFPSDVTRFSFEINLLYF